jgi:anaerobic magnesium-protoporphyrin IX monomethyl ester cyclase
MKRLRLFLANIGRRTATYYLATPPMGILYLASYLRTKFELDIKLVNQRAEDLSTDQVVRRAAAFGADIVGFGCITTGGHMLGDLTRKARQALPNALILVGGPHTSAFRELVMEGTEADAAVVGEGELAFEQIIRERFDGAGDFSRIPGLIWRDRDGQVITNPGQTPMVEDLDTLPPPAYDLIDLRKYWPLQSMTPLPKRRYISLVSSRGCPYQCMWCHNIFGKRFRAHSPERMIDEIEQGIRRWGITDVEFLDDIFNLDKKRVIEFCDLVHRRNLRFKITFPNAVRTDILDRDVVDALADTGLYFCSFALEAGSPRIQQYTGKRLNIPQFLQGVEMAVSRGIFANGFAMLGFPTETEADMQQTLDVACASKLHTVSFFTVMPFPHTRLYDEVMRLHPERLAHMNYDNVNYATAKVNCSEVPDEVLYYYQREANRRFYLSPKRILRILRDYPQPQWLPFYLPIFLDRITKGLLDRDGQR